MLIAPRGDGFGLGRDSFVAGGPQLYRAGGLALLAPVPLRAVEALPHTAVIANENFFSHANLVSTSGRSLCQALFSALKCSVATRGPRIPLTGTGRLPEKNVEKHEKKACLQMAKFYNAHQNRGIITNTLHYHEPNNCSQTPPFRNRRRHWFCFAVVSKSTLCAGTAV